MTLAPADTDAQCVTRSARARLRGPATGDTLIVDAHSNESELDPTLFIEHRVKHAVVDAVRQKHGTRPAIAEEHADPGLCIGWTIPTRPDRPRGAWPSVKCRVESPAFKTTEIPLAAMKH